MSRTFKISALAAFTIGFTFVAASAFSADPVVKDTVPVPPDVAYANYDWAGPFVGVHVDWREPTDSENGPSGGFLGGVHIGYNFQVDRFVFGPVAEFGYSTQSETVQFGLSTGEFDARWNGSLQMRAGAVFDRLFVYGTGGIEATRGTLSGAGWSDSNTHIGWTAGIGAEYQIKPNWTLGFEGRFTDFGSQNYQTPFGDTKVEWDELKASIRLNYKF